MGKHREIKRERERERDMARRMLNLKRDIKEEKSSRKVNIYLKRWNIDTTSGVFLQLL